MLLVNKKISPLQFNKYNSLFLFIKRHGCVLINFIKVRRIINILIALVEMRLRKLICISRPFIYRIDPSTLCNLRSVSCDVFITKTNQKEIMSLEDFKQDGVL